VPGQEEGRVLHLLDRHRRVLPGMDVETLVDRRQGVEEVEDGLAG
jgi:hypothetical protein